MQASRLAKAMTASAALLEGEGASSIIAIMTITNTYFASPREPSPWQELGNRSNHGLPPHTQMLLHLLTPLNLCPAAHLSVIQEKKKETLRHAAQTLVQANQARLLPHLFPLYEEPSLLQSPALPRFLQDAGSPCPIPFVSASTLISPLLPNAHVGQKRPPPSSNAEMHFYAWLLSSHPAWPEYHITTPPHQASSRLSPTVYARNNHHI